MQAIVRPPRAGYLRRDERRPAEGPGEPLAVHASAGSRPVSAREQAEASLTGLATSIDRAGAAGQPAAADLCAACRRRHPGRPRAVDAGRDAVARRRRAPSCSSRARMSRICCSRARRRAAVRSPSGLAIGANRCRLVRQFLTESVVLAVAGGALGVALAWGVSADSEPAPPPAGALPVALDFALDARVLAFSLALSIAHRPRVRTCAGPARLAARDWCRRSKTMRSTADESIAAFQLRAALVVAQVALSLALLVAAGLFFGACAARRPSRPDSTPTSSSQRR